MNSQIQEAARQILGQVSDIQAVVSMTGLTDVNDKLADIREKAAWLFEGNNGRLKVMADYMNDAHQSLIMLGGMIHERGHGHTEMDKADLLQLIRMAEIFVNRGRIYLNSKERIEEVVNG